MNEGFPEFMRLLARLEATSPITRLSAFRLERLRSPDFLNLPDEENLSRARTRKARAPLMTRGTRDLAVLAEILEAQFDDLQAWAHLPPPGAAKAVATRLGKLNEVELKDRFLTAWSRHIEPLHGPEKTAPPTGDERLDLLQSRVPGVQINKAGAAGEKVEFACLDCGGFVMSAPDDDEPTGPVLCKACGQVFGTLEDIQAVANYLLSANKRKR